MKSPLRQSKTDKTDDASRHAAEQTLAKEREMERFASAPAEKRGRTPLIQAIEQNAAELVEFCAKRSDLLTPASMPLIGNGSTGPSWMATPLMQAVRLGHAASVEALLKFAPYAQCAVRGGLIGWQTPIDQAVEHGHADCVALLAPYSRLKSEHSVPKVSPLTRAAELGMVDIVRILAPHTDLNERDGRGKTPLTAAAGSQEPGATECFMFLAGQPGMEMRPKEDRHDEPAAQALLDAIRADNLEIVRFLATFFDLNARWNQFQANSAFWGGTTTALFHAVEWQAERCFEFLLPRCEASLEERRAGGSDPCEGKTAMEKAFYDANRVGTGIKGIRMADALCAKRLLLGRPLEIPPMQKTDGSAVPPNEVLEHLPHTRAVIEAQALRAQVAEAGAVANAAATEESAKSTDAPAKAAARL